MQENGVEKVGKGTHNRQIGEIAMTVPFILLKTVLLENMAMKP